jgi:hypothetical protein
LTTSARSSSTDAVGWGVISHFDHDVVNECGRYDDVVTEPPSEPAA